MTTYTTPHFAAGASDGNVRPNPAPSRARPAPAATYRAAGVTNEAALMAEGQTADWQPGASKGVPKAAIGALGAALVGGVALAIVLMAPSSKVTKPVMPDPIAQAAAANAAVDQMDKQAPAAGSEPTTSQAASAAADAAPAAAVPTPVEAVVPAAPPVVNAPVARVPKARATPRVAAPARTVTPPADVQPPAMQQTPDTTTVTPSTPAPVPTPDTPVPTPAPAPAQ